MWGAVTYLGPLICQTLTSKQRKKVTNSKTKKKDVKGYTKSLVKKFLKTKLAPNSQMLSRQDQPSAEQASIRIIRGPIWTEVIVIMRIKLLF